MTIRVNLFLFLLTVATCSQSARADLLSKLTVSTNQQSDGSFIYAYMLTNESASSLPVVGLSLTVSVDADLRDIAGPSGWNVGYTPGDTSIIWESSEAMFDLSAGSSTSFSFISNLGPAAGNYFVVGLNEVDFIIEFNDGQISMPSVAAQAVPEPASLLLSALGSIGLIGYLAFRRAKLTHQDRYLS